MNEFRLHHLVSELLSTLQLEGGDSADAYVELLSRNMSPYVTTQVSAHTARKKIASFSANGEGFLRKYDELKAKQVRQLDPLVYILSKISEDAPLCNVLSQKCRVDHPEPGESAANLERVLLPHGEELKLPPSGSVLSMKEFNQLRGQLESVTHSLNEKEASKARKSALDDADIPTLPEWVEERSLLSADYSRSQPHSVPPAPLMTLPIAGQEMAIVRDLLYLLVGIEGKYISVKPLKEKTATRTFSMDRTLDVSLQSLVTRMLPICSHFSTISRFVDEYSKFEHGVVNQALCASMRDILKEYLVLVAQLEHQFNLSLLALQKLWYYLQPCARMMEILSSVSLSVERASCHGGAVLSILHTTTSSFAGDDKAQELCLHLTQATCVPYFEMVQLWVYQGVVSDPYREFMVEDNKQFQKDRLKNVYNDAYWEERYTVKQEMIPSFLEKAAEKILHAGKYLNVIRECGLELSYPHAEELIYSLNERHYTDHIERAYSYASRKLMDLLIKEQDVIGRIVSLKHFFLLDQADYLVHFMDMAEEELQKMTQDISLGHLESLMDLAVRSSTLSADQYRDDLRVTLVPYSLVSQLFHILSIEPEVVGASPAGHHKPAPIVRPKHTNLPGMRSLSLDYVVQWPVSLVISRKALTKYQLIFRHLLYCRHIERQLGRVWTNQKSVKKIPMNRSSFTMAFSLRQRMLSFVQNIQYYMTVEVLEPHWCVMEGRLREVATIDEVLREHNDFLDRCLKDCMLTNSEILKLISRIFTLCDAFATILLFHEDGKDRPSPALADDTESQDILQMLHESNKDLDASLSWIDREFSSTLVELLDQLNITCTKDGEHYMASMIGRLDCNGFYTAQLEESQSRRLSSATPPRL